MDQIKQRLSTCFRIVFPDLPESEIGAAKQSTLRDWDSVATITLVNVVEEEFGIQLNLDYLADLDSFEAIAEHLKTAHSLS
jgi:acyl carrier protein